KGTIHTKYIKHGIPAHGSRPWLGENAIDTLMSFYSELKEKWNHGAKNVWDSTLNLGVISGGNATNMVADYATMQVDFRYIDQEQADEYYVFESTLMEKYTVSKELIVDATNISVKTDDPLFLLYMNAAASIVSTEKIHMMRSNGSHDVREFFKVGILPILFMPRGGDHHTDNEWILREDLDILL